MWVPKLKVTSCTECTASHVGACVHVLSLEVMFYKVVRLLFGSEYGAVPGAEVTKPLVVLQKQEAFHSDP